MMAFRFIKRLVAGSKSHLLLASRATPAALCIMLLLRTAVQQLRHLQASSAGKMERGRVVAAGRPQLACQRLP